MIFTVTAVHVYQQSASLSDVINGVGYTFMDSGSRNGGGENSVTQIYFLQLDSVSPSDFVSYNTLTSSSLQTFVQRHHGNNWGAFTSSVATSISASLSENINSSKPIRISNWQSGSFNLNASLSQSYFVTSSNSAASWY